ncbi:MAG: DUF2314 domain-containing protein [Pseudomonadota bacterium]
MKNLFCCLVFLIIVQPAYAADEPTERLAIYQYALYLLPDAEGDPRETLNDLVTEQFSDFMIVDDIDGPPTEPMLIPTLISDVGNTYTPPDLQFIGYFGHGLTREQALAVQDSERALVIDIGYPARLTETAFPQVMALMAAVAVKHDGLIWDEASREIFTPQAWREERMETWNDGVPDAQDHIAIHAYKDGEYVRAITLGMEKFGLPDFVVNDFPWSSERGMATLINLVTQTLIEGGDFNDDFSLDIDIEAIKHAEVRDGFLRSLLDNAEPRINLKFRPEEPEQGDPDNFILAIQFDVAEGDTLQEKQEVLLDTLFGSEDSVTYVKHDAEILAARDAARAKLPQLRNDFNNGFAPGEFIFVKAPFKTTDGGNEWMWVEVIEWKGDRIRGLLQNDPFHVPELRAGAEVVVEMGDVFDYILQRADGTSEGNETGRIMRKYEE